MLNNRRRCDLCLKRVAEPVERLGCRRLRSVVGCHVEWIVAGEFSYVNSN